MLRAHSRSLILIIYQVGLRRCGKRIAQGLVKYGLGRALYGAMLTYANHELTEFLVRWRGHLQDKLRRDPQGFIGRVHPALASSIPATFPNLGIARLFISPHLLDTNLYAQVGVPQPMNISQISTLCELYFTWGSRAEILKTLRTSLWIGEAVRMLVNEALVRSGRSSVQVRDAMKSAMA